MFLVALLEFAHIVRLAFTENDDIVQCTFMFRVTVFEPIISFPFPVPFLQLFNILYMVKIPQGI